MTKWEKQDSEHGRFMWDFSIIKDMLINPVYIGSIASQKRYYQFKTGNIGDKKPDEWVVVENCHEPIVDKATFQLAQDKLHSRQRPRNDGNYSLFAGLIKCGECGKALTYRVSRPKKEPVPVYCCKTYNAYGKRHCTQHRIPLYVLKDKVLETIQNCAKSAAINPKEVLAQIDQSKQSQKDNQKETLRVIILRDEERLKVKTGSQCNCFWCVNPV